MNDEFIYECTKSYYERNIENYKQQDGKAKRKIPRDSYVNVQWLLHRTTN